MTNEIPKGLARNNGLFGWLEAVWVVVVVVVVGAKTGFQPLQLSRLSPLVLRLTPGSTAHVFVYARASRASRDGARRFSVLGSVWKTAADTKGKLNGVKTPSVWSRPQAWGHQPQFSSFCPTGWLTGGVAIKDNCGISYSHGCHSRYTRSPVKKKYFLYFTQFSLKMLIFFKLEEVGIKTSKMQM